MLCYVVLCCVMLCHVVSWYDMTRYVIIWHDMTWHDTSTYDITIQHNTTQMQSCSDVLSCDVFQKDVCCLLVSTFNRNRVLTFFLIGIIYMIRMRQNVKTRFLWNVLTKRRHASFWNTSQDKTSKHDCILLNVLR